MGNKPLATTGVASMLAGDIFFMGPNSANGAYPVLGAFALWLAFGISTAFAGDSFYNRWNSASRSPLQRFGMLWMIIILMFCLAFVLSKLAFFIAGSST